MYDSTTSTAPIEGVDDLSLIEMSRDGSTDAFAELYRRYAFGATRLARHLGRREESEDVVADSFAKIFDLLRRGKGPDSAFRAYLFTTVRRESGRRAEQERRVRPTDDDAEVDDAVPFGAGRLDGFERTAIRAAYESLPDRWRTVLWHLDVEGRRPAELAEVLDLSANSVSALVYRARTGLRVAYLQQHVNAEPLGGSFHLEIRAKFAAVLLGTTSPREREVVHAHLASCESCLAVYLEVEEIKEQVA